LHGKLSVADESFVTVGSYNINNISAYASIELNLDVLDVAFCKKTSATLHKIISQDCIQVTQLAYNRKETFFVRAWQRICYNVYRLLVYLFTFYFKKQHG